MFARLLPSLMLGTLLCTCATGCFELFTRAADERRLLGHKSGTVVVRAFIDGRDMLSIEGDRFTWTHLDSQTAAVGRWNGNRPTIVNGISWYPDWGGATNFRAVMSSPPRAVPYVPAIPRYRDTRVTLHEASGGRQNGAAVQLLPRVTARAPIVLLIDNTGSDYNEKWVQLTLAWATSDP